MKPLKHPLKAKIKMLLIEYVGHIGLRSLTDSHRGRHLEYFKSLNDARVASVGFIKYTASTTRNNKEKTLKSSSMSFWFSTGLIRGKSVVVIKVINIINILGHCKGSNYYIHIWAWFGYFTCSIEDIRFYL